MAGKSKKKSNLERKILIALCVVLSLILAALIGAYLWADNLLSGINRFEPDPTDGTQPTVEIADPTDTVPVINEADAITTGKQIVNILLVGQDRRSGQGRMHSDAMILVTINKVTKQVTMTSFMRDMWVYIPDHYNERINVPYMVGGFDLLNKTLEYNFGVCADYNVEIDFFGFMQAIDLVGGIEIELTGAEARYLNRRGNWEVDDDTTWSLVEGVNKLTGSQALAYSRIRDIGDDFERTSRQRTVLTKLIEKAKGLSTARLYELVKGVIPMLTTDMTNGEILGLALELIPMLSDLEVVSQRIPADGEFSFANKGGASVIALSESQFEANKKLLENAMRTENEGTIPETTAATKE